jgi:hypothetical protein
MVYPCIVYQLNDIDTGHASNLPYRRTKEYQITVMDRDPDTLLVDKVSALPTSRFERFFTVNQLNHYVFTLDF